MKFIATGAFLFLILFCMWSFLGLTGPTPIPSSRLLTSLNSGRKLPVWWLAEDMLALFYRLLLRTCSLPIFFLTRTSFIVFCYIEEKRDSANELLPTLTPRLEFFLAGLFPKDKPLTMRGEAISLMLMRLSLLSSRAIYRYLYLRFMLKKFREHGSISWSTLMILVNISEVTFWLI